jgi:hypothetical protein
MEPNGEISSGADFSGCDATDPDQISDNDYIERMIRHHKIPRSVHKKQQMEEEMYD